MKYLAFKLWIPTIAFSIVALSSARSAPGDEHWSHQFDLPGTTNMLHAIEMHKGRLYCGGLWNSFTTTLDVWDGTQWSVIGTFAGNLPTIYDLAWAGDTLYAGGSFTNVDGQIIDGLARWNGAGWSDIGFHGTVYALLWDGTNLYVGGIFTNIGPVTATNIACWNGSAWSALGNSLGKKGDSVLSLAKRSGVLYAGGSFTNSGALSVAHLASWNGSVWSSVGGGAGDDVYALLVDGEHLYAGGIFGTAGLIAANGIARWDGTNWSSLSSGVGNGFGVFGITVVSNRLFAAGSFTSAGGVNATNFAVWDGASWSAAETGLDNHGYCVVADQTNVYVGGAFNLAGRHYAQHIAAWDGARWNVIGPADGIGGLQSTVRAITGDGTNLYAGGDFQWAASTNLVRVGRYDGTNWWAFGTGLNASVRALALVGTNVYAGGTFTGGAGGPFANHLARWNGTNWVSLNNVSFATVNALATRGNDLLVAGYFNIATANGTATWLARWDGTNFWNDIAFDENTLYLYFADGIGYSAIATDGNNTYLSGHFNLSSCDSNLMNCTNCPNVLRFDGTYARVMGTGLNSNANTIAIIGTNIYFAGPFTNAGGNTVSGIARWDGNAWSNVGGGVVGRGTIVSLAAIGTNLYAAGTFTNMGGVPAARLAKWDGNSWSALGSSTRFGITTGSTFALYATGPDLYVGGTFSSAGSRPSYHIARWNESINFDVPWLRLSNPSRDIGGPFRFSVTAAHVPSYVIEMSTDLRTWTPLFTNNATPYDHIDSVSPATPSRLYRGRIQP